MGKVEIEKRGKIGRRAGFLSNFYGNDVGMGLWWYVYIQKKRLPKGFSTLKNKPNHQCLSNKTRIFFDCDFCYNLSIASPT